MVSLFENLQRLSMWIVLLKGSRAWIKDTAHCSNDF